MKRIILFLSFIAVVLSVQAKEEVVNISQGKVVIVNGNDTTVIQINPVTESTLPDTIITHIDPSETTIYNEDGKIFQLKTKEKTPFNAAFAWGLDLGSSIDMSGQDMTTFDLEANFGMKSSYFSLVGVGGGVRIMVNNSSRSFPLYAVCRSNFTNHPTLCFAEVKAGVAFTNINTDIYQNNFMGSIGVGVNLARGKTFSSHLLLSYTYMPMKKVAVEGVIPVLRDIHYASIKIGASF